jgi:hypothetical protein
MGEPLNLRHIQVLAGFIMLIGTILLSSMVIIALGNLAALKGVVATMFIVGCAAGALIVAVGAVLFFKPKIGQLGSVVHF